MYTEDDGYSVVLTVMEGVYMDNSEMLMRYMKLEDEMLELKTQCLIQEEKVHFYKQKYECAIRTLRELSNIRDDTVREEMEITCPCCGKKVKTELMAERREALCCPFCASKLKVVLHKPRKNKWRGINR